MKNLKCLFLGVIATLMFVPAVSAQQLVEGEIMYEGTTKLEKCDTVLISFVMSADKKSISRFYYKFDGIHYQTTTNGIPNLKKLEEEGSHGGAVFRLKEDTIDSSAFIRFAPRKWQITIKNGWGTDVITGVFNLIYRLPNGQVVDLGTSSIELKKVEPEQAPPSE